jgi:hypothetical protein
MTTNGNPEAINILLSREELLYVLNILQAETIPGLDADPLGQMDGAQYQLALVVAERALRARELAISHNGSGMVVHNALLTAVGVCAYAQNSIFVYHWPSLNRPPLRLFGHIRGNDIVTHARPDDVLHRFSILPQRDLLIETIFNACDYADTPANDAYEIQMGSNTFVTMRELAAEQKVAEAVETLLAHNLPVEPAQALVNTMAGDARVSVLQTIKQVGNERVEKRDFTILQNAGKTWLVIPENNDPQPNLLIKNTEKTEIANYLAAWV